jgi:protein gp37
VNEFSDLLFAALPAELVIEHFRVFNHAQCHQFQVLTKRSERLASLNASVPDCTRSRWTCKPSPTADFMRITS